MSSPSKAAYLNSRQHRFALNILAGMRPQDAFLNSGYSTTPSNVAVTPYQMLDYPNIAKFIAKKRKEQEAIVLAHTINESVLSKAEKRQILAEIARATIADHLDGNGNMKLDKARARALKEYSKRQHTDKDGNTSSASSIKLVDVIAAIQEDNKMMGDYAPTRHQIAERVVFEVRMTPRRLAPSSETGKQVEGEAVKQLEGKPEGQG